MSSDLAATRNVGRRRDRFLIGSNPVRYRSPRNGGRSQMRSRQSCTVGWPASGTVETRGGPFVRLLPAAIHRICSDASFVHLQSGTCELNYTSIVICCQMWWFREGAWAARWSVERVGWPVGISVCPFSSYGLSFYALDWAWRLGATYLLPLLCSSQRGTAARRLAHSASRRSVYLRCRAWLCLRAA